MNNFDASDRTSVAFMRESEMEGMYHSALGSEAENVGQQEEEDRKRTIARGETKAVSRTRIGFLLFFGIVAIVVSVTSFVYLKNNQKSTFETEYYDTAGRLMLGIQSQQRLKTIQTLAESIMSHSINHDQTWPQVTVPDWEIQAGETAKLADVLSINLLPIVDDTTRNGWESYSVSNQGWLKEGLTVQKQQQKAQTTGFNSNRRMLQGAAEGNLDDLSIPEFIHRIEGFELVPYDGPAPYVPNWQLYPAVEVPELVNFNIGAHIAFRGPTQAVLNTESAVVSRSFDFTNPQDELATSRRGIFYIFLQKWERQDDYQDDPIADLYWPIFDSFDSSSRKLVGMLNCVLYWRLYFENILSNNTILDAVLENSCDQAYTYQINGPNVQYVGSGDLHDKTFDEFMVEGEFLQQGDIDSTQQQQDQGGSCLYSLKVYPTKAFQDEYVTSAPAVAMVVLLLVFVLTAAVFVVYDVIVERRQRIVMTAALANSAIVSSLFPENVRHRLYHPSEISEEIVPAVANNNETNDDDDDDGSLNGDDEKETFPTVIHKTKPIADLFENCTVLFADIVGFTAFCDGREPTDVFTLLETLYGKFDEIATKRSVFKVETIGDCYLAVTGLPTPQKDHAVIMSLFAHECMKTMKLLLVQELRSSLGSDVSVLGMRFGLHSGPVTAGVLRGEKSRFQLFGDTVNTAARMESTGQRDKIQLSQESADLLVDAGKGKWLSERADMIQAKGKGELQTYWLKVKSGKDMNSPSKRTRTVSSDDSLTHVTEFTLTNLEDEEQDLKDKESKHARYNSFAYCNSSNGCLSSDGADSFADIAEEDYEEDDGEDGNASIGRNLEEQMQIYLRTMADAEAMQE